MNNQDIIPLRPRLEELLKKNFKRIESFHGICSYYENEREGVIYDSQRDVIIAKYTKVYICNSRR